MSKLIDDIVICVTVVLCLGIALFLAVQLVDGGSEYPPTLISTFLGISIAALTYRFLGGTGGTEFSVGLLKLGGSAALLLGTAWFVGDRLRDEIRLYSSMNTYREQIGTLETERRAREGELDTLRRQVANAPAARGALTLAEIRKLKPDDPFVRDLRTLVEGEEGPFRRTIRDLVVKISVIATDPVRPEFRICGNTLDALNEGTDVPSRQALLSRTLEDGSPVSVRADRLGKIDADVCADADRQFDVQINCPVALTIFRDTIASCAEGGALRGRKATLGALAS